MKNETLTRDKKQQQQQIKRKIKRTEGQTMKS